jgi:hypothetical protein
MAEVSSGGFAGATLDDSDAQDWNDVLRILEETDGDGNLGKLRGSDAEGYAPPREISEVPIKVRERDGKQPDLATFKTVGEAADRLRRSELDAGDLDVEEERGRDEGALDASVLQQRFAYPLPVFGSAEVSGNGAEESGDEEQDEEAAENRDQEEQAADEDGDAPLGDFQGEAELEKDGDLSQADPGSAEASPDGGEVEKFDAVDVDPVQTEGDPLNGTDGLDGTHEGNESVAGYAGVRKLLESRDGLGEAKVGSEGGVVPEAADLVGFIRVGLEPAERVVYDRLVATFLEQAQEGDSNVYDFLLLCGFTATITRRVPRQLYEAVKGIDDRLLKEVKVLQTGIAQATTELGKVSSIPEELVKVSRLLQEMTTRTEFHLAESQKLHADSLGKFNAALSGAIKAASEAGEQMERLIRKRMRPLHWVNWIYFIVVSFALGVVLTTLLEAAFWQKLKATALAEADARAGEEAELFRKKVDAAQPAQSILARLQEHGLIVSGQRGKFTDLSGTERKAFILSVRSAGAEQLGEVNRSERQADLYFLEP